ncbi:succinylglutamate desuccinylase/aspartoacylase family protein [Ferrimicrobium sp.]|uniref:succinylglutamate desuccinylase/aspartoacylase family protein n=1 Tax=Ferrimicrobium sp. TaxID=2926050 RepID=UPI00260FCB38|nr:succinylglutamate desuccinylase/aspartoacylase family protein [Ferrimicrobium sp.]
MQQRFLHSDLAPISHLQIPYFEIHGANDGPTLTLVAGVHGCEYTSQQAVRTFLRTLEPSRLGGRIRAVPTLNLDAFYDRSPFVSPRDQKNLNRCFPGDPEGTYSDALAYFVTEELIKGSDFFIDLHAGDMVEDLFRFTIYDDSPVQDASRLLAEAYGFPFSIHQPMLDPAVTGATSQIAGGLGIPSIIAESGGRGLVESEAIEHHLRGLARTVAYLGMYEPTEAIEPDLEVRHFHRFVWLRSKHEGWWAPTVAVGEDLHAGQVIGTVSDLFGEVVEEIQSPVEGVAVFLTSSPAMKADGLVIGIGADEEG